MESKHKAGDKVRVKSLEWYNSNKNEDGEITMNRITFIKEMSKYCGEEFEIRYVSPNGICHLKGINWFWSDWMFEEELSTKEQQTIEQLERVQAELDKLRALCNN